MTDNLAIWNTLGRTSPEHTKGFKRGGGFSGTAVKPIYTEQKMTEMFGPCGIGWGVSEPTFQLVPGSDGQTAVYCWLTLWFVHDGARSQPIPGVGGDFVIVKQSSGLRTDDEAFKKAFTDAIGNAMKHIGMSADVHMGRFDDSKYVQDLKQEDDAARKSGQPAGPALTADAQIAKIKTFALVSDMFAWANSDMVDQAFRSLPEAEQERVSAAFNARQAEIEADPFQDAA
jgi:hypothetical protein